MFGFTYIYNSIAGKRKAEAAPDKYAAPAPLPEDTPLGDQWQTSAANNFTLANATLLECRRAREETQEQKRLRLVKFDEDMDAIERKYEEDKHACILLKNTDMKLLDKKEIACTENEERASKRLKTAHVNVCLTGQASCALQVIENVSLSRIQLLPELLSLKPGADAAGADAGAAGAGGEAAGAGGEAAGAGAEGGS
jgi:hypothetical protein